MAKDSPSIRVEQRPVRDRARKRRTGRSYRRRFYVAVGIAASLAACVGAVIWIGAQRGGEQPAAPLPEPTVDASKPASDATDATTPPTTSQSGEVIVADDGQLLWASPTAGEAIALDWIPDGTQIVVHLLPRQLAAHGHWQKVVAGLGPWGEDAEAWLRRDTRCEPAELETLLLAATMLPDGVPGFVVRATLATPWDAAELNERFPQGETVAGPHPQVLDGQRVALLPSESGGRTLVIYPASLADNAVPLASAEPALVRDLERLLSASDSRRSVSLFLVPRFLQAGGAKLLGGPGRSLRRVVQWLLDDDATAIALALHLNDNLFIELAATPTSITPPRRLALNLSNKIHAAADEVEDILLSRDWPAYGQKILIRFPSMLRQLARYTRFAAEEQTARLRCYLPAVAAHNLVTAGQLLLTLPAGELAEASAPAAPRSLDARLAQSTSLVFAKETLENSLAQLSEAIDVPIVIAGRDLQLMGITRNQSLALNLRDQPAVEILQEILRRANPDQAAESLSDPRQQLVYVISRDETISGEEGSEGRIIVTTRTAATTRGERLPDVFVLPED